MKEIKQLERKPPSQSDERLKRREKSLRTNLQRRKAQSFFVHHQQNLTQAPEEQKEEESLCAL